MKIRTLILLSIITIFWGCTTCRVTSVEDAARYSQQGYETRIAVYRTGLDGLLWGSFLWTHHAQAQVLTGNEWKWVGITGLSETPTFSIMNDEIYYWRAGDFAAFLKQQNLYY